MALVKSTGDSLGAPKDIINNIIVVDGEGVADALAAPAAR